MKTRRIGSALHIVIVGLVAAAVVGFGLYTYLSMQPHKRLPAAAD